MYVYIIYICIHIYMCVCVYVGDMHVTWFLDSIAYILFLIVDICSHRHAAYTLIAYGVAIISRLFKNIGLFCRILFLS